MKNEKPTKRSACPIPIFESGFEYYLLHLHLKIISKFISFILLNTLALLFINIFLHA